MKENMSQDSKTTQISVIRAKVLGYCMGVRRAVEIANKALLDYPNRNVWTLGPLIHNERALNKLAEKGIKILSEKDFSIIGNKDVVIIRAHGVPPTTIETLKAVGATIVDATCPRVMISQKRAADYAAKGIAVIIAGDKNHGEVAGIAGCTINSKAPSPKCLLIENKNDAKNIILAQKEGSIPSLPQQAALICQTTLSRVEYDAIAQELKKEIKNLEVLDTICPATTERQEALSALKNQVQGVLIVGGKNSANTQRLLMTATNIFTHAALIESALEIPSIFYTLNKVGIAAGASTPDEIIEEVENALKNHIAKV